MDRQRRGERGFTILDTMIAALVMIVGVVGLLSMQLVQIGAAVRGRQLSEASALMQQKAEELRLLPVPTVQVDGPVERLDARGCPVPPAGPPACMTPLLGTSSGTEYSRTFRLTPNGPGGVRVLVRVFWQDNDGQPHEVNTSYAR